MMFYYQQRVNSSLVVMKTFKNKQTLRFLTVVMSNIKLILKIYML